MYYGGQAGGGKTDLGLGLAVTKFRNTLTLRRQSTQLSGIETRYQEIIGGRGKPNTTKKTWIVDNFRRIEMGGCDLEKEKEKYKGRPHDMIHFDEGTDFTRSQFLFIIGWLRTVHPGIKPLVLITSNPPMTSEGDWIVDRYAAWLRPDHPNPAKPGEIRWYVAIGEDLDVEVDGPEPVTLDDKLLTPTSRTFIPAGLDDNPYFADGQYRSQLQKLPPALQAKLLNGDFSASRVDAMDQLIPSMWLDAARKRFRDYVREHPHYQYELPITSAGLDCARGGFDQNALAMWHTFILEPIKVKPGKETPKGSMAATWADQELGASSPKWINVDVIGIGSSVFDFLGNMRQNVYGIAGNGRDQKARDKSGKLAFYNYRAQMYWMMREALDPDSGMNIMLPDDIELHRDLAAPRWELTQTGIKVESKEDIIERIGRSPDKGDAAVLGYFKARTGWGKDKTTLDKLKTMLTSTRA